MCIFQYFESILRTCLPGIFLRSDFSSAFSTIPPGRTSAPAQIEAIKLALLANERDPLIESKHISRNFQGTLMHREGEVMKKSYWLHVRWYKGAMPGMQPQYGIIATPTPIDTGSGSGAPQAFYQSWEHLLYALGLIGYGDAKKVDKVRQSLVEHGSYLIQDAQLDDDELRAIGVELPQSVA